MGYIPCGVSAIERFRIRRQTDEQKKFVAGMSTAKKVLLYTVTVLLLYKARHDCGKLQKGRVVLTSKKQEKQREGRRQHPPPGLEN